MNLHRMAAAAMLAALIAGCQDPTDTEQTRSSVTWARTLVSGSGEASFVQFWGVASGGGKLYAAASASGDRFEFGNGVAMESGGLSEYPALMAYDSEGTPLWATPSWTGGAGARFAGVAADETGAWAAGSLLDGGTYDLGGRSVTGASGESTAVLVRYGAGGAPAWTWTPGSGSPVSAFVSVAADGRGNAVAAGSMRPGTLAVSDELSLVGVSPVSEGICPLIIRFGPDGTPRWAATTASSNGAGIAFTGVAAVPDGTWAVGFTADAALYALSPSVTVQGALPRAPLIVRYDAKGAAQWAATILEGSTAPARFTAVVADKAGNAYAVGYLEGSGTCRFGPEIEVSAAPGLSQTAVMVKYSPAGGALWARAVSAGKGAKGRIARYNAVTLDRAGNVRAAGELIGTGTYEFGDRVTAEGNAFPGALSVTVGPSGVLQAARCILAPKGGLGLYGVADLGNGKTAAAGYLSSRWTYDFDNGESLKGSAARFNPLLLLQQ